MVIKLAAVVSGGQIYTSGDSGVTWTPHDSNRYWQSITSSADGIKLAAVDYGGQIYTSSDSGGLWTPRDRQQNLDVNHLFSRWQSNWRRWSLAGQIYTSSDSGVTWTPHDSNRSWYSITSSADGVKLAAVVYGGQIYTSSDSGVTWTPHDSNRNWQSITSSADGVKLAAVVYGGQIYTSGDSGANLDPQRHNRDLELNHLIGRWQQAGGGGLWRPDLHRQCRSGWGPKQFRRTGVQWQRAVECQPESWQLCCPKQATA